MVLNYLLDTDACIALLRNQDLALKMKIEHLDALSIGISSIVVSELVTGVLKSRAPDQNRERLEQFLECFSILPYDQEAAWHYGAIRAHLEKAGTPIGPLDMLIAAHARSLGAPLLTHNTKEFQRVPQLKCEAWI